MQVPEIIPEATVKLGIGMFLRSEKVKKTLSGIIASISSQIGGGIKRKLEAGDSQKIHKYALMQTKGKVVSWTTAKIDSKHFQKFQTEEEFTALLSQPDVSTIFKQVTHEERIYGVKTELQDLSGEAKGFLQKLGFNEQKYEERLKTKNSIGRETVDKILKKLEEQEAEAAESSLDDISW